MRNINMKENKRKMICLILSTVTLLLMACSTAVEPTNDTAVTDSMELVGKEEAIPAVPTSVPIPTEENKTTEETTMTSLEGTAWHLPSLSGETFKIALPQDRITLAFADGQINGSAGCNRYFASYMETADGTLTFSPIASTRRACERSLMQSEQQFLQALQATTAFTVSEEGSRLALTLGEKGELSFSVSQ